MLKITVPKYYSGFLIDMLAFWSYGKQQNVKGYLRYKTILCHKVALDV